MKYRWRDEKSGKEVEVERRMRDFEAPPTREEAMTLAHLDEREVEEAVWRRAIAGGTGHIGFGMKGRW